jgi:hypothetical protein
MRLSARTLVVLLAAVALLVAVTLPASAAGAGSSSCSGFTATVIGSGAKVSGLHARGTSCAEARRMAQRWLTGLDHSDGRYLFTCSPPAGAPAGRCSMGHYRCVSKGVSGALAANSVTCRDGRETVSWRADFDEQEGSTP